MRVVWVRIMFWIVMIGNWELYGVFELGFIDDGFVVFWYLLSTFAYIMK